MLARDLINLARDTELKQLKVKDDDNAILGFINLGVIELYKRFYLLTEEAVITIADSLTRYTLDSVDENVSMPTNSDLTVILEVHNEDGDLLVLNDEESPVAIMTPSFNVVEFKDVTNGDKYSITYRATPKFITSITDEVKIPPQLIEALLNYVGYRGHSGNNGDIKSENNTHYMRFNDSCKRVNILGLNVHNDLESNNLVVRGFH